VPYNVYFDRNPNHDTSMASLALLRCTRPLISCAPPSRWRPSSRSFHHSAALPRSGAMDASQQEDKAPLRLFVKGDNGARGDCPFSQFVLLLLEEMGLPYSPIFENLDCKSEELLKANPAGKVPVLVTPDDGPVAESASIAEWLDSAFPEAALAPQPSEACTTASNAVFPAFVAYLKSGPAEGQEKLEEFEAALGVLESYLQSTEGEFLTGETICKTDLQIMPKLYHAAVALKEFRGWELDRTRFPGVATFMNSMMKRSSWERTKPPSEGHVVRGWARHVTQ